LILSQHSIDSLPSPSLTTLPSPYLPLLLPFHTVHVPSVVTYSLQCVPKNVILYLSLPLFSWNCFGLEVRKELILFFIIMLFLLQYHRIMQVIFFYRNGKENDLTTYENKFIWVRDINGLKNLIAGPPTSVQFKDIKCRCWGTEKVS